MALSLSPVLPVSFAALWLLSAPPLEQPLAGSILVRALNPVDGLAVVQESDGDLRTLRLGDAVFESFKVTKVLGDRLVAEGVTESGIKARLWIYKAAPSDESSRVVVLEARTKPEKRASPQKPPQ